MIGIIRAYFSYDTIITDEIGWYIHKKIEKWQQSIQFQREWNPWMCHTHPPMVLKRDSHSEPLWRCAKQVRIFIICAQLFFFPIIKTSQFWMVLGSIPDMYPGWSALGLHYHGWKGGWDSNWWGAPQSTSKVTGGMPKHVLAYALQCNFLFDVNVNYLHLLDFRSFGVHAGEPRCPRFLFGRWGLFFINLSCAEAGWWKPSCCRVILGLRFLATCMALEDLNDKVCVELLMGAVFGIAALVGSPTGGEHSNSAGAAGPKMAERNSKQRDGRLEVLHWQQAWQVEFPKFKGNKSSTLTGTSAMRCPGFLDLGIESMHQLRDDNGFGNPVWFF